MRSVVDRNVVRQRIPVHRVTFHFTVPLLPSFASGENELWDV